MNMYLVRAYSPRMEELVKEVVAESVEEAIRAMRYEYRLERDMETGLPKTAPPIKIIAVEQRMSGVVMPAPKDDCAVCAGRAA